MVQMAFFLRFLPQLRRTRGELVSRMEETATSAIEEAGGTVTVSRRFLLASFDENQLAFWLDMLVLIEKLGIIAENAAADLYGYSLLLGKDFADTLEPLCRFLSGSVVGGGVFLDQSAIQSMRTYLSFEEQGAWAKSAALYNAGAFFRVKESKMFIPTATLGFPLRETIANLFEAGQRHSLLIMGKSFDGKRDELYRRFAGLGDISSDGKVLPLFIRFGKGGINALTDSLAAWVHTMPATIAPAKRDEIADCWGILFAQRLKTMPSAFAVRLCSRLFALAINQYSHYAKSQGARPIVILENINSAEQCAADIAIDVLGKRQDILLLGTCTTDIDNDRMQKWKPMFHRHRKSYNNVPHGFAMQELSQDLWEISYVCSLLGRYFPCDLIRDLLQELGKSPAAISRAISLLHTLRIVDTPLDPRPWSRDFSRQAETALGQKKEELKTLVSTMLLAWVKRKKLNPCVCLLEALAELGCARLISDSLILQSLYGELASGDRAALEAFLGSKTLETMFTEDRTATIRFIIRTLIAIHFEKVNAIHAAFSQSLPNCTDFPLLRAQALFNQSLYHLAKRDNNTSLTIMKTAALLCRGDSNPCLAHCYRVFALTSLSQKRIGEAVDYSGFALENAAQHGGPYEIGMAAYCAATLQLLQGNLTRAQILAEKARRHFFKAENPDWADRSYFLEGRVAFEAGYYRQAIDVFKDMLQKSGDNTEKKSLLEAWTYRARVYGENPLCSRPEDCCHDADMFEVEALYISENFSKAVELSSAFAEMPETAYTNDRAGFLYTERPDWSSGFAQCELLYFSQTEIRKRLFGAYHALASIRLTPLDEKESVNAMQRVLRNGQFPEIDPADIFYHYAWYRVLEQTNANAVDVSTAVSVGYKRLLSRASRIDDPETSRQYVTQPRWNKALAQAAAQFKLI